MKKQEVIDLASRRGLCVYEQYKGRKVYYKVRIPVFEDVYDMFVARFTWLARVISFEAFSMMVDEALERMKKMLESNKAMQTLVSGEAGETVEKDM